MSAIGPYSQSYDMKHMYNISDFRYKNNNPPVCYNNGSITDWIMKNPSTKLFANILQRSLLANIYDDNQANFTLFIAKDEYIRMYESQITHFDILTSKNIINMYTLPNRFPLEIFRRSKIGIYPSRKYPYSMLIETNNKNNIIIDKSIEVIEGDIICNNGIIHIIDNLIVPCSI